MRLVDRFKELWTALPTETQTKRLREGNIARFVREAVEHQMQHNPEFKADKGDLADVIRFVQEQIENDPKTKEDVLYLWKKKNNPEETYLNHANKDVLDGFLDNAEAVRPNLLTSAVLDHGIEPHRASHRFRQLPVNEELADALVEMTQKRPDSAYSVLNSIHANLSDDSVDPKTVNPQAEKKAVRKIFNNHLNLLSKVQDGTITDPEHVSSIVAPLDEAMSQQGLFYRFNKEIVKHLVDRIQTGKHPELDALQSRALNRADRESVLPKLQSEVQKIRQQGSLLDTGISNPNLKPEDIIALMDQNPDIAGQILESHAANKRTMEMKPFWGKVPLRHANALREAGQNPSLFVDLTPLGNRANEDVGHSNFNPTTHLGPDELTTILSNQKNHKELAVPRWTNRVTPQGVDFLKELSDLLIEHHANPNFKDDYIDYAIREDPQLNKKFEELFSKYGVKGDHSRFNTTVSPVVAKTALALVNHDPERAAKLLDTSPDTYTYGRDLMGEIRGELHDADELDSNRAFPPSLIHNMKNEHAIRSFSNLFPNPYDPEVPSNVREALENEARQNGPNGQHFDKLAPKESFLSLPMYSGNPDMFRDAAISGSIGKLTEHGVNASAVEVKRRSENLRYLRDYLETLGNDESGKPAAIDPKDLPKDKTWNSILATSMNKKTGVTTTNLDWNPLRDPKRGGKVTAESVQRHIDQMKPTTFHALESHWNGGQRHNNHPSEVVVFGISDDHVKKMKDAGVFHTFLKATRKLPDNHPNHPLAIGWARYTSQGNRKFLDEIQSDLGRALSKVPQEHAQKINDILFEGSHPSEVLHEAFLQYGRQKGWVGHKLGIHSTDTKRWISLGEPRNDLPIHFIHNYENFPQNKLNAEPGKYGEDHEQETNDKINGLRVWRTEIRKMEEYSDWEDL